MYSNNDYYEQVNETSTLRWNYGDPTLGTCKETIQGGNHFRYWIQNGKNGNSGAIFLAASYELPIARESSVRFSCPSNSVSSQRITILLPMGEYCLLSCSSI